MKITKYISLIALLATTGCSDFLDQQPTSDIPQGEIPTNEAEVGHFVVGVYNALLPVNKNEWALTEMRSDNTRVASAGSTSSTTKELVQLDQNALLSSTTYVQNYWEDAYNAIYRSNFVLQYLHLVITPTLKSKYEGELRFLRAYHYFNLVRLWGPAFLMDRPISPEEGRYKQRSTVDETYRFILDDLEKVVAGQMLPTRAAQPKTEKGRVVLEAAKALLAKVYITYYPSGSAEYVKARDLLGEVIASCGNPQSGSDLVPFEQIFSINNEMNDEIIFAVRYRGGRAGLGAPFGNYFAPTNSGSAVVPYDGSSYNYVASDIIDAFKAESGDERLDVSLAEQYITVKGEIVNAEDKGRFIKKFLDPSQVGKHDGENDWPIIRMGDVLLLYAELQNELQRTDEAVKYLNIIRERAGLNPTEALGVLGLRKAIREERRKELAFENHRFHDIVRWGEAVKVINTAVEGEGVYPGSKNTYPYIPIKSWCLLLPIPQSVINVNPQLPQNPGY